MPWAYRVRILAKINFIFGSCGAVTAAYPPNLSTDKGGACDIQFISHFESVDICCARGKVAPWNTSQVYQINDFVGYPSMKDLTRGSA